MTCGANVRSVVNATVIPTLGVRVVLRADEATTTDRTHQDPTALKDRPGLFIPARGAATSRRGERVLLRSLPAGAGRRSPEARRGHSGSGPSPCPVALPEETASRIDLGRRDLSRRARGAPAPRVSGSGAGPRNAQGSPSARMILRAISPASLWPARDRHGNSPIVAMAIRRGIYRGMRDRRRTVRRGPLSGSIARLDARHGVVVPRQLTASDRFHALAQGLQVRSHDAGQFDHDVAHEPGGPEDGDHDHTNANSQLGAALLRRRPNQSLRQRGRRQLDPSRRGEGAAEGTGGRWYLCRQRRLGVFRWYSRAWWRVSVRINAPAARGGLRTVATAAKCHRAPVDYHPVAGQMPTGLQ